MNDNSGEQTLLLDLNSCVASEKKLQKFICLACFFKITSIRV